MDDLVFTSVSGRSYTYRTVVPLVLSCLRQRVPECVRVPGWQNRVKARMRDPEWMRFRNGQTPSALARDLDNEGIVTGSVDMATALLTYTGLKP